MPTPNDPRQLIPGQQVVKRGMYEFKCPECGKVEFFDERYEPCCTGPHPSLDEHPLAVMELVRWHLTIS